MKKSNCGIYITKSDLLLVHLRQVIDRVVNFPLLLLNFFILLFSLLYSPKVRDITSDPSFFSSCRHFFFLLFSGRPNWNISNVSAERTDSNSESPRTVTGHWAMPPFFLYISLSSSHDHLSGAHGPPSTKGPHHNWRELGRKKRLWKENIIKREKEIIIHGDDEWASKDTGRHTRHFFSSSSSSDAMVVVCVCVKREAFFDFLALDFRFLLILILHHLRRFFFRTGTGLVGFLGGLTARTHTHTH